MNSAIEMPFLYQTRTILRHQQKSTRLLQRQLHQSFIRCAETRDGASNEIENNENPHPSSFLRQKAQQVAEQAESKPVQTMTATERLAFRNLRTAPEPLTPGNASWSAADDLESTDSNKLLDMFAQSIKNHYAEYNHRAPAVTAEKEPRTKLPLVFPELQYLESNTSLQPPMSELHGSRAKLAEEGEQVLEQAIEDDDFSHGPSEDEVNRVCREYMAEISSKFSQAIESKTLKGDVALWKVLEKHVFPMIYHLKPKSQATPAEIEAANRALPIFKYFPDMSPSTDRQQPVEPSPTPPDSIEDSSNESLSPSPPSPSLSQSPTSPTKPLLTRLYPATTLLALRLFSTHYPLSPYTSTFIRHLRSLGASSYILGANIHFYNTLLRLRWTTYSSLRELVGLLSEMERGGVEFNRRTYMFLMEIVEQREVDLLVDRPATVTGSSSISSGLSSSSSSSSLLERSPLRKRGEGDSDVTWMTWKERGVRRAPGWWRRSEQVKWFAVLESWRNVIARRLEAKGEGIVYREGTVVQGGSNGEGQSDYASDSAKRPGDRSAVWL